MRPKELANILRHKTLLRLGCGALILCIALMLITGGSPERKLIDRYFKAFEKNDAEAVLDLFYKPIVESEQDATGLTPSRYLKDVDKFYGRYGDDLRKTSISNIQYFEEDLLDFYNNIYFDEGAHGAKIKAGCEITVDVVNDEGNEYTMRFNCFKIKGKWYIYSVIR